MPADRKILKTSIPDVPIDLTTVLPMAARLCGRSQAQVAFDLIAALAGSRKLKLQEYFVLGGWLGEPQARAAVIGQVVNRQLCRSLIAQGGLDQSALMRDKYLASLVLAANGFPVPEIKAAFATEARFGRLPTVTSVDALVDWLRCADHLPAFGKPVDGSTAFGAIPLRTADEGQVDIGEKVVGARALAKEVAASFPRGWLIQEQLRQPPEIEALIGPAIGTVRLVTIWEEGGPKILYGMFRQPTVGTWVDATIHDRPNVFCELDSRGRVVRAQKGNLLTGEEVTQSQITPELPLVGAKLAQWGRMVDICLEAHRLFPGHALIGWDIAMTVRGPVISELNAWPAHMVTYQRAFRRGFLHTEHRQRLDVARRLLQERAGRR